MNYSISMDSAEEQRILFKSFGILLEIFCSIICIRVCQSFQTWIKRNLVNSFFGSPCSKSVYKTMPPCSSDSFSLLSGKPTCTQPLLHPLPLLLVRTLKLPLEQPQRFEMCEITCHLFRDCHHYYRILALCTDKKAKRLQQYNQARRRLEYCEKTVPVKQSSWSCFSSSSPGSDPLPRPLLRPATEFTYLTRDPPKAGTRYSCRGSKISQKTCIQLSACQECSPCPVNTKKNARSKSKVTLTRVPANRYKPLPPIPKPLPPLPRSRLPSGLHVRNYHGRLSNR